MECHVSERAAKAYCNVALQRHGQSLPEEGLLALVAGDTMGPSANFIYEVCVGNVDGAQGLKSYWNECVTIHYFSVFL